MARLTPTALFERIFPDRRDPMNPGHYLCRFCGKPTIHTRRHVYCSDECFNLCQKAVSWLSARRETWKRDGGKCVRCVIPVKLYDGWYKEGEGDSAAECHHIKSVSYLNTEAVEAVYLNTQWENIDKETKRHWWAVFYTILYLDINNLQTLCGECHKMVHKADLRNQKRENPFKVARTHWNGFWEHNDRIRYTRKLEDFVIVA